MVLETNVEEWTDVGDVGGVCVEEKYDENGEQCVVENSRMRKGVVDDGKF